MRFQRLSLMFFTVLMLALLACGKSAEEEAKEKEAQAKAAKAATDRANAASLSKLVAEKPAGSASPELVNKLHKILADKPEDSQALKDLAKVTTQLEPGVLFGVLMGPPPKLDAPWPATVDLAHSVADAASKDTLKGAVERATIFKDSPDPYTAYVALSKRSDPIDRELAAVVAVKYATFAAKDFVGQGEGWLRFLSNHLCAGEGCVLPEVLSKMPAAIAGNLPSDTVAIAQALNHLHGLATAHDVPEAYKAKLSKAALEALSQVKQPVYADLNQSKEAPEEGAEKSSSTTTEMMAWPLAQHADFILTVRKDLVGLASKAEIHLGVDGPFWSGGDFIPLLSLDDLELKPAKRKKKIEAAVAEVKKQLAGSEARVAVQVGPKAPGTLLGGATEILSQATERAPRTLITDAGMPGGLGVWFVDLEDRPEGFPETALSIRRVKDAWTLDWPAALPAALDEKAVLPESVTVKILGRAKNSRARITVKIAEEGAELATLKAALVLLKGHYGLDVEAVRMNVVSSSDGAWVQDLLAAAQRSEATQPKPWMEGAIAENNEFGGIRAVALKTYAAPKKEKVKAPAKPKALPPALGYCQKRDIERVMKSRRGAFKFCYQRSLQMNPSLSGKIVTRFRINEEGKVTNAIVLSNTMGDRNVPKCLVSNVKKLKFPRPQGGQCEVRWPFNFQSR